uniref:Uncharacterized protein n=1 Tax=Rhizophora mucronata TaxID=61149 RepID=A0A2P2KTM7_RHIMU
MRFALHIYIFFLTSKIKIYSRI